MDDRNEALWALLSDEELAACSDEWRYAARDYKARGAFGLERFAIRMSDAAYGELNRRIAERAIAENLGVQLRFTEAEYRRVFEPGA